MKTDKPEGLSWRQMLRKLANCTKPEQVEKLLEEEMAGPDRVKWKQSMLGRIRVLRKPIEEKKYGLQ